MTYHIGLDSNYKADYAILPGDPSRVQTIANYLENPKQVGQNREYTTYLAYLANRPVLIMSTGMGGPSTAIGVEELFQIGVRNFIRVGTCGGMNEDLIPGDLVIATGSIRMEGTSDEYVPIEFPAVANFYLTSSLEEAARDLGYRHSLGIVQCKDSFYGQHNPDRMPNHKYLSYLWEAWIKAGALASEMESASLFIVSQILGARAACVLNTIWNHEREKLGYEDIRHPDMDKAIKAAIRAIEIDMEKNK